MNRSRKWEVAIIADKVMPYRTAFYRRLSSSSIINLTVLFIDRWGIEKRYDPTMGIDLTWGEYVLQGINYIFLKNVLLCDHTYTGADRLPKEMRLGKLGTIIYYLRSFFGILCLEVIPKIMKSNFDLVIVEAYSSFSSFLSILSAKLSHKKVVLRTESDLKMNRPMPLRIIKYVYLKLLFTIFDQILYSSTSAKKYYLHYGVNNDRLTFVPSAVDNEFFRYQRNKVIESERNIRNDLNISEDMVIILGIGRMVKRKNWDELINATEIVKRHNVKLAIILVGDGPEYGNLTQKIKELSLINIFLVGFKSQFEISYYYESADIIIQTSKYDPSPKVLNEALNFGLPLIVSDRVGTADDICIEGFNGCKYQCGNINDLSKKVLFLINNQNIRLKYGENSLKLTKDLSLGVGVYNFESFLKTIRY